MEPSQSPTPPNTFRAQAIHFHLNSDNLIWTGNRGCSAQARSCHAEAQYSTDNELKWSLVDIYVRNCTCAKDVELNTDPSEIICESYRDKKGNQHSFRNENPMELVTGQTITQIRGGFLVMSLALRSSQSFWSLLRYVGFL
jgi:hypothetical protein